jgi:hypothetical protein
LPHSKTAYRYKRDVMQCRWRRQHRAELASRLEDFLLTRRADILLREFVFGAGGDMDVDGESDGSF